MARTLWPLGSVVCFKEYPDFEYTLTDRVTIGHKKIIALWNKEKFSEELELVKLAPKKTKSISKPI